MPFHFPGPMPHHRRQGCRGEDPRVQGCCLQSLPEGIDACLRRCLRCIGCRSCEVACKRVHGGRATWRSTSSKPGISPSLLPPLRRGHLHHGLLFPALCQGWRAHGLRSRQVHRLWPCLCLPLWGGLDGQMAHKCDLCEARRPPCVLTCPAQALSNDYELALKRARARAGRATILGGKR